MLRSQSHDLLVRGLSRDLVLGEPQRARKSFPASLLQNISRVLRPFRSTHHVTNPRSGTRWLDFPLFRVAQLCTAMCLCMAFGRLALGGLVLVIKPHDIGSLLLLPSEARELLQDAAAAPNLDARANDLAIRLAPGFAANAAPALAPQLPRPHVPSILPSPSGMSLPAQQQQPETKRFSVPAPSKALVVATPAPAPAPVPTAAGRRLLAIEPAVRLACSAQHMWNQTETRSEPLRSTRVRRAYETLLGHHMLRFQCHRTLCSKTRVRSFMSKRSTLPESAAPSLAETERILATAAALPARHALGLTGTLPAAKRPNLQQTVQLVVERIRARKTVK